jgi:hypothetical protein
MVPQAALLGTAFPNWVGVVIRLFQWSPGRVQTGCRSDSHTALTTGCPARLASALPARRRAFLFSGPDNATELPVQTQEKPAAEMLEGPYRPK